MAIPTKDSLLVAWSSNFDTKVTANPATYTLSAGQATSFHTVNTAFVSAYNAVATAKAAGQRSKPLTATKDAAKAALLAVGRMLYSIVQDATSVSAANKEDVGVVVKKVHPTPIPAPSDAPGMTILATIGNTVKLRLFDATDTAKRGKPAGVNGAALFSFVGTSAPTSEDDWNFEGITGKTIVDIVFASSTAPGAKVWFTARWFNERKQNGPAAEAIGTNIPGGAAMAA